ncbi:MAG: AIR synthase-related protein [Candidatus Bathyarchaeia archaeon]
MKWKCLFAALLAAAWVNAQNISCSLSGVVQDPAGAVIPSQEVVLEDARTGFVRTTKTTNAGFFSFPDLAPSRFHLRISAKGFKEYRLSDIEIASGEHRSLRVIKLEIGDVAEIIRGVAKDKGFDLVVACIGEVSETGIIRGNGIRPGDGIIGLRSSGIHSNGVTLARKVLLRRWGGVFDAFDTPEGLEKPIIYEMLEPTKIYVKPVLSLLKEFKVKAVVHITGDAYLKFEKLMALNPGVGFEFTNFKPQPIFNLIQEASRRSRGPISDSEMLRTFNMGWGLALVVDSELMDGCLNLLNREGGDAEAIGHVDDTGHISAFFKGRRLILR